VIDNRHQHHINIIMNKIMTSLLVLVTSICGVSASIDTSSIQPVEIKKFLARECERGQTIYLLLTIETDGNVSEISLVDCDPYHTSLAQRVVGSVKYWRFQPAVDANGQPVQATVRLPIKVT
jgi:hypothetical protein